MMKIKKICVNLCNLRTTNLESNYVYTIRTYSVG